jgi:hypothetical protein
MYKLVAEVKAKETDELTLAVASELELEDPENAEEIINANKSPEGSD